MKARHELLLETLGEVFDEEEHAYKMVAELSWLLPTIIICGGLLDLLFIVIYMRFAHPWREILYGEKMSEKDDEQAKVASEVYDDIIVDVPENDDSMDQDQNTSSQDQIR